VPTQPEVRRFPAGVTVDGAIDAVSARCRAAAGGGFREENVAFRRADAV